MGGGGGRGAPRLGGANGGGAGGGDGGVVEYQGLGSPLAAVGLVPARRRAERRQLPDTVEWLPVLATKDDVRLVTVDRPRDLRGAFGWPTRTSPCPRTTWTWRPTASRARARATSSWAAERERARAELHQQRNVGAVPGLGAERRRATFRARAGLIPAGLYNFLGYGVDLVGTAVDDSSTSSTRSTGRATCASTTSARTASWSRQS